MCSHSALRRAGEHEASCQPPNKQLERTIIRRHVRAACASPHCAHAARWTHGRAAAELRRYVTNRAEARDFGH
jgi:hypothetical protein